eukprot:TRINITY_DN19663_c0_g1_i1.p3 TRINITY_DN19663_c0_g1~~TRINITY_DN19663_c0_g1_i1.p3  ORF type:complete len:101 (-),score=20.92 TRINITY_DN19663_c0_g1_i1:113-415(-)
MFADEQALCGWLHDTVALHPFSRPSEAELETMPMTTAAPEQTERRLDAAQVGDRFFDVIQEGARSGFDTRVAAASGASRGVLTRSFGSWCLFILGVLLLY